MKKKLMEKKEFNVHALYFKDIIISLYIIYLLKYKLYGCLLLDFQC